MALAVVLVPWMASAQVYCSRWAEIIDAPSNIRAAPGGHGAIACRLSRNGQRLLVVPLPASAEGPPPQWLATMACRSAGQRGAIGLGRGADYIHRSQVRLLGINLDDWVEADVGQATGACEALWRPYHQPGDQPAVP